MIGLLLAFLGLASTLAGSGVVGVVDGTGTAATFTGPSGVSVDTAGIVYVTDRWSHRIRKVTATGVTSLLGMASSRLFANFYMGYLRGDDHISRIWFIFRWYWDVGNLWGSNWNCSGHPRHCLCHRLSE